MTSIHHGPSPSGSATYDSIPYCPLSPYLAHDKTGDGCFFSLHRLAAHHATGPQS